MTTYTAAQAIAAYQTGVTTGIDVVDTEANIVANLAGLEPIGYARDLNSLSVSDGITMTLTGAAYWAARDALRVNGTNNIVVTNAQVSTAGIYSYSHVTSVSFVDSAANVNANLGDIHLLNGNTPYTIALTDGGTPHFTVSVNDWTYNRTVFPDIVGTNFTVSVTGALPADAVGDSITLTYLSSVAVSDTAAGIGAGLDQVEAQFKAGKLSSLTMTTSTPIPVTLSQITSDADVLAMLPSSYTLSVSTTATHAASVISIAHVASVSVQDSGTNLGADLDVLQALAAAGKLTSVTPTDYTALAVSPAQITADAQALALFSYYAFDEVVTAAQAGNAINQPRVVAISVQDTAANISANISTIRTLATALKVANITVTDGGVIQVTDDQYNTQTNWRAFLTGPYSISISGVYFGAVSSRLFDSHVSSVGVLDTASEISYELDSLELTAKAGRLASISFTDGGTPVISLTAAQIASDADAIALIAGPFTLNATGATVTNATSTAHIANVSSVSVSDSIANIGSGMSTLVTLASQNKLGQVVVSDYGDSLTLTGAQFTADQSVLTKISGNYHLVLQGVTAAQALSVTSGNLWSATITDSAANIAAHLDALQGLAASGEITSMTFTDTTTPTLALTSSQVSNDSQALHTIQSAYNLAASGALTVAALQAQSSSGHGVSSAAVADTAAHVSAALDLLQSDVVAGNVASIALTDSGTPTMTLSLAQEAGDAAALAKISGAYKLSLTGVAVAAVTATLAQNNVASVAVTDTAADVSAELDGLQSLMTAGKLAAVTISDGLSLAITQAQLTSDAPLLNSLTGSYRLTAEGVSAAGAASAAAQIHISAVSVSDSAANVAANLSALESLALSGKLASISLTDSGTPVLPVSAAQLNADALAIADITGTYKLAATSVPVSLFGSLISGGHITAASISDIAANVVGDLDALAAAATAGTLTSIALTDAGTPSLNVTASQFTADASALGVILGAYGLDVTQVSAANADAVAATHNVSEIGVSDIAANISTGLDGLQALFSSGKLTSLTITDGGTLSVSAAQMVSDAQVINDIAGNYHLAITDASLSSLNASVVSHASSISVSDTSANIASNLDTLQSYAAAGKLTSVTVTDSGSAALSVTAAQFSSDAAALNDLSGNYTLKIDASNTANLTLSGVAAHANTVSFANPASDYAISVSATGDTVTVTDSGTGRTSTDHLSGITALQFGSQTDIVAQTPGSGGTVTTGNVTELYGAVFGRLPDVSGLKFYENSLGNSVGAGQPLQQFAQWFLASPEYADNSAHNYAQSSAGDAQFITDCYTNLLGRAPESASVVSYYETVINGFTQGLTPGTTAYQTAQTMGHAYVLTYFSASNEFLGDVTVTAQNPSSSQHWLLLTNT